MKLDGLVETLRGDIERNRERYEERTRAGDHENAAIYAGKEMEARRVLMLIEGGFF